MKRTDYPHGFGTMQAIVRHSLWVLLLTILFCIFAPVVLGASSTALLMQEHGLVEGLSVVGWLSCAVYIRWYSLPRRRSTAAFTVVFVVLAIREAGWPHQVLGNGKRLLSFGYYLHGGDPLAQRILIGAVVLVAIAACVYACIHTLHYLLRADGLHCAKGQMLLLAFVLLLLSQGAESLSGRLPQLGLPAGWKIGFLSLEEGLECLAPGLVLAALRA